MAPPRQKREGFGNAFAFMRRFHAAGVQHRARLQLLLIKSSWRSLLTIHSSRRAGRTRLNDDVRRKASELLKLGEEITSLGIPTGTKDERVEAFKKELTNFRKALDNYRVAAESGVDADLKASYSALHDSFTGLKGMLPRK